MSKIITSPVKKWPGTVVLSDPLTFPQLFAFEDAINAVREGAEGMTNDKADGLLLPGILACVEEFQLTGFPAHPTFETFPSTPRIASNRLIAWLAKEITALYQEAETVPNE